MRRIVLLLSSMGTAMALVLATTGAAYTQTEEDYGVPEEVEYIEVPSGTLPCPMDLEKVQAQHPGKRIVCIEGGGYATPKDSGAKAKPGAAATLIEGTDSNDSLYGDAGPNIIKGYGIADGLYGRAGNDKLVGGAGNDRHQGGRGADVHICGAGSRDVVVDVNVGDKVDKSCEFQQGPRALGPAVPTY